MKRPEDLMFMEIAHRIHDIEGKRQGVGVAGLTTEEIEITLNFYGVACDRRDRLTGNDPATVDARLRMAKALADLKPVISRLAEEHTRREGAL